ncbi:MAG: hypothetical protein HY791_05980 [Deltaproteobacteria bacterium]|nr:hypothetical protein [Deltaproteobacteria bacterium]
MRTSPFAVFMVASFVLVAVACESERSPGPGSRPDARASDLGLLQDAHEAEDATVDAAVGMDATLDASEDAAAHDAGVLDAASSDAASADAGATDLGSGPCAGPGGFCWLSPRGFGATLNAVSGSGPDDVWGVGAAGVVFHRDSQGWAQVASPTASQLQDVHVRSATDVWAVGDDGAVIRFDGQAWRSMSGTGADDLYGVFSRAPNDVWMVGAHDFHHYDGVSITQVTLPFAYDPEGRAVIAFADDDVWVGTRFGTMLHFDGTGWTYDSTFYHDHEVTDLWGSGPSDVWAVSGYGAEISHWDGLTWSRLRYVPQQTPETVESVHGTGPDDVWFVGQLGLWHYDGSGFTRFDAPVNPNASIAPQSVWASAGRVVVVGWSGQVFEYSGGTWSLASGSAEGVYERWFDIEAIAPNDVWFFGLGAAMHFDGQRLADVPTVDTPYRQDFTGSWSNGTRDIWVTAIGSWGDNLQRYDGSSFSRVDTGAFVGADWLLGVWGSGPNNIYFAAGVDSFRWDGSSFTRLGAGGDIQAIHGTGPNDVWAVSGLGGGGSVPPHATNGIWHYDGAWSQPVHDGVWWSSVFALSPTEAWAGGGGGTVKHWNGTAWTQTSIPGVTTQDPQNAPFVGGFAGTRYNDVWASAGGRLMHWDGIEWTVLPSFGIEVADVAVASDGSVLVTGSSDSVLRRP